MKRIVSDSNNIFLWRMDQEILTKMVVAKIQLILILHLQVTHDYVHRHYSTDSCVKGNPEYQYKSLAFEELLIISTDRIIYRRKFILFPYDENFQFIQQANSYRAHPFWVTHVVPWWRHLPWWQGVLEEKMIKAYCMNQIATICNCFVQSIGTCYMCCIYLVLCI